MIAKVFQMLSSNTSTTSRVDDGHCVSHAARKSGVSSSLNLEPPSFSSMNLNKENSLKLLKRKKKLKLLLGC